MKDSTKQWLDYAQENLDASLALLESELFNPCLQNTQQAIEKALKALLIYTTGQSKKTHSTAELCTLIHQAGVEVTLLSEDEQELIDSIYLPTKYPIGSALPYFDPDSALCGQAIALATRVLGDVRKLMHHSDTIDSDCPF